LTIRTHGTFPGATISARVTETQQGPSTVNTNQPSDAVVTGKLTSFDEHTQ
jgi:hypothetical protein